MLYSIATASSSGRLMAIVQQQINDGWEPLGGPMAIQIKSAGSMRIGYEFSQALTKTHTIKASQTSVTNE